MEIAELDLPKAKITQLNKKNIFTVEDLSRFFPRKYYDFRNITPINELKDGQFRAVVGEIMEIVSGNKVIRAIIKDDFGSKMNIIWFRQPYIEKMLVINKKYIFCGKVQINTDYNSKQIVSPLYWGANIEEFRKMMPVYSKVKGMSDDYLRDSIGKALNKTKKDDYLEESLLKNMRLIKREQAFNGMHSPVDLEELSHANKRFVFDDLFAFSMQLAERERHVRNDSPYVMQKCTTISGFVDRLPFDLTEGQKNALQSVYKKMKCGERVNALVQGDVGSGKTIVAIILMLISAENGFQSALMAPTTVLAKQHYLDLLEKTEEMGYKIGFLSGDMKAKEKREVYKGIESGEIDIVVGTHAILSKDVCFKNLALTIVDEEHRFGVMQRDGLNEKREKGVHSVIMSATPIPRTLALSVYGQSIDVLTIKTLPKGRKPIQTFCIRTEEKAYESMYRQINEGRQCYVVCPLIEDSEAEGLADVDSAETTYKKMEKYYEKYPEVKICMISGKMKQSEIAEEIDRFSKGEYQIIISTTIIEVGVNVPNASVILIKNAERFGLAQLHQLRGRVGRGEHQSYCVLLSTKKENLKLKAMCETTDGFKIAEKDLELRGTGDFIGVKQSGSNKYVMLMLRYADFFEKVKKEVENIYKQPDRYNKYKHLLELDLADK